MATTTTALIMLNDESYNHFYNKILYNNFKLEHEYQITHAFKKNVKKSGN